MANKPIDIDQLDFNDPKTIDWINSNVNLDDPDTAKYIQAKFQPIDQPAAQPQPVVQAPQRAPVPDDYAGGPSTDLDPATTAQMSAPGFGGQIVQPVKALAEDLTDGYNASLGTGDKPLVNQIVDPFLHPLAPGGALHGPKTALDALNVVPEMLALNAASGFLEKATRFGGEHGLDLNQAVMGLRAAPEAPAFLQEMFGRNGDPVDRLKTPTTPESTAPVKPNLDAIQPTTLSKQDEATYADLLNHGTEDQVNQFFDNKGGLRPDPVAVKSYIERRDAGQAGLVSPEDVSYFKKEVQQPTLTPEAQQARTAAVKSHIDDVTSTWKNKPDFEVVHSADEIADPDIRAQAKAEGADENALGFLGQDGKVRIFADNIKSPDELSAVVYHEALGHHGLSQTLGDNLDNTLKSFMENNVGSFGDDVSQWLKDNPDAYKNDPNRPIRAAEEVLAEQSEAGQLKPKLMDIVSNKVKAIGRKAGVDLKYSDREINTILSMAHDAVVNGKGRNVAANGFRYMYIGPKAEEFGTKLDFTGPDNKLKAEISDHESRLLDPIKDKENPHYLDEVLHHPELYRNYPKLRDIVVSQHPVEGDTWQAHQGAYYRGHNQINVTPYSVNPHSTILHEVQHAIQEHEGWQGGSNSTSPDYNNTFGEIEARDTQARADFNPMERQISPRYQELESKSPESVKFMRRKPDPLDEDGYTPKAAKAGYDDLLKEYEPKYRSFAEAKRAASDLGISSKDLIKGKQSVGEIDKKLFMLERAARMTDTKWAEISKRIDDEGLSAKNKDDLIRVVNEAAYLNAKILDSQAEVGRALNSIKAMSFTKKKLGDLNKTLEEHGGTLAPLADDATFLKFKNSVDAARNGKNPAGANALIRSVLRPYWWQYALSFRHNMMLSGLATHAKNIADNTLMIGRELEEAAMALPGGVVRSGINKLHEAAGSKTRVQSGVSPEEIAGRLYGLTRAALDSTTYKATADAFLHGHGNREISSKVEMQDPHIPVVDKVSHALHAQDTFFRAFMQNTNMYALGVRMAREQGFKGSRAFQEGSNLAMNPTPSMLKQSKEMADSALLVDKPQLLFSDSIEASKSIKPGMTPDEQTRAAVANIMFPFFRVSDRLIFQKIRRSPLSFLDKTTREDFRAGGARRDIAIARTAFGSALIYYYWNQAGKGNIEGASTDYKKEQALAAGGHLPNSIKDSDRYTDATALNLSANPLDLHNSIAADVATIRKAYEKSKDAGTAASGLIKSTKAFLGTIASNSFADNISMYTEPFAQGQSDGQENSTWGKLASNTVNSFLPAAARQLNQRFGDTTKRDTAGDKSVPGRVVAGVMASTPGLSDKLPIKYDVYGQPQDQGKTVLGTRNYQKIKDDPTIQEIQRLERTTDKAVVTEAPRNITVNGNKISLDGEAYSDYQRVTGWYFLQGAKKFTQTDAYKNSPDERKVLQIKEIRKQAASAAKAYLISNLQKEQEPEE